MVVIDSLLYPCHGEEGHLRTNLCFLLDAAGGLPYEFYLNDYLVPDTLEAIVGRGATPHEAIQDWLNKYLDQLPTTGKAETHDHQ